MHDVLRHRAANHMQMICKYGGKMAADNVADVVLSAAVFFSKFSELKTLIVMKTRMHIHMTFVARCRTTSYSV